MDARMQDRRQRMLLILVFCAGSLIAHADDSPSGSIDALPPATSSASSASTFSQPELEQMLAPIALYPDALLAQILMAATYPLEVVEAARWSQAHADVQGDEAVRMVAGESWDASVKSLVAFPQVLGTLNDKLEWTQRLGDAFLAQQTQVMDTVQDLRRRADDAGTLKDEDKLDIAYDDGDIAIGSTEPGYIYVPYCDPFVSYGAWPWVAYPPVFWSPWPNYYGFDRCSWSAGVYVTPVFLFGSFRWHDHYLHDRRFPRPPHGHPIVWHHDPIHRHGIAYRDSATNPEHARRRLSTVAGSGIALPPDQVPGRSIPGIHTTYAGGIGAGARGAGGAAGRAGYAASSAGRGGGESHAGAPSSGGSHSSSSSASSSTGSSSAGSGSSGSGHSH